MIRRKKARKSEETIEKNNKLISFYFSPSPNIIVIANSSLLPPHPNFHIILPIFAHPLRSYLAQDR